jgi:hypothetical protein
MNLTPYISNLQDSLVAAAAAGDEETRRTAELLTAAIEPAGRLALMHAFSDLAAEVTAALPDRVVEVALDGPDLVVRVVGADMPARSEPMLEAGNTSRVTLRLPDELKARADETASADGISLNAWLTRVVADAVQSGGRDSTLARGTGHRIRGWVQG